MKTNLDVEKEKIMKIDGRVETLLLWCKKHNVDNFLDKICIFSDTDDYYLSVPLNCLENFVKSFGVEFEGQTDFIKGCVLTDQDIYVPVSEIYNMGEELAEQVYENKDKYGLR